MDNPFLLKSPLTEFKWQYANRLSDEVGQLFFPSAKSQSFGDHTTDGVLSIDPDCNCDLTPDKFTVFYDKNNTTGFQKDGDEFLFTVKIYVSRDGLKIEQAYKECLPAPNEVIFYLEDNTDDTSEQKLFARFGSSAKKSILTELKTSGEIYQKLNEIPNFSRELFLELIEKGVVEEKFTWRKALLDVTLTLLQGIGILGKALGWICEKLGQGILSYLSIPEKFWDTDNEKYFLKRENIIASLTIGQKTISSIEKILQNTTGIKQIGVINSTYIDEKIRLITNTITSYINGYNEFVKKTINRLYDKIESGVRAVDMVHDISEKVAFLCGVWNGLVDFIGGTLKFIGIILSAPFDLASDFDRNLELYDNFIVAIKEFKFSEFWAALVEVWAKIKKYFRENDGDGINTDKVAYATGFGLAFVGTFFVPFAQIAKVGNVSKIGKAFIPANYLENISNTVNKASNAVVKAGQKVADDIYLTINKMLSLLKKGKQAFVEFFENIWEAIAKWFLKQKSNLYARIKNFNRKFTASLYEDGIFRSKHALPFAKVKDKAPKAIKEYEEWISKFENEFAAILPTKGEIVKDITSGIANRVSLGYENAKKLFGAIVTHNHPVGGSLSAGDFKMFLKFGLKEIRAKCPDGSVFSLKNTGKLTTKDDFYEITDAVEEIMSGVNKNLEKANRNKIEAELYIQHIKAKFGNSIEYVHFKPK